MTFELDLIASADGDADRLVHSPALHFEGEQDLLAVCDAFLPGRRGDLRHVHAAGHGRRPPRRDGHVPGRRATIPPPPAAGSRRAYWPGGFHDTPVYDYDKLQAGNVVAGPAIIDSDSTTYVLPASATPDRGRVSQRRHRAGATGLDRWGEGDP